MIVPVFVTDSDAVVTMNGGGHVGTRGTSASASAAITWANERTWGHFHRKVAVVEVRVDAGTTGVAVTVTASATVSYDGHVGELGARAAWESRTGTVRGDGVILVQLSKTVSIGLVAGVGSDSDARAMGALRTQF